MNTVYYTPCIFCTNFKPIKHYAIIVSLLTLVGNWLKKPENLKKYFIATKARYTLFLAWALWFFWFWGHLFTPYLVVKKIMQPRSINKKWPQNDKTLKLIKNAYSECLKSERSVWETEQKMVQFSARSNFKNSGHLVRSV